MKLIATPIPEDGTVHAEVRLSRRNLVSLLAKVEGHPRGSFRMLQKTEVDGNVLVLIAETDDEHYAGRGRPGRVHPDTEAAIEERPA